MDAPLTAIDSSSLEDAIVDRFMKAVGGNVRLSRHGHIAGMLAITPAGLSTKQALERAIVPLVDLLLDDIAIATTEPWPSRTDYSMGAEIEESHGSITIVLRSLTTGDELVRLGAIPIAVFVKDCNNGS
jgi:hypothetical protein